MKVRTKSIIMFLVLSLAPLMFIGTFAYRNGKETIEKNLGSGFQQIAHEAIDKIDRILYGVYRNVYTWAELELMQEVVTGDVDGRISSFLMGLSKEYGYFSSISVIDGEGGVAASSIPGLIGENFWQEDFYEKAVTGTPYVKDIHLDELSNMWAVSFSFPIRAKFGEGEIIGVLYAVWDADELFDMTQLHKIEEDEGYYGHIMLIRNDGMIIAAPRSEKKHIFRHNLIEAGLASAFLASQGKEGYLVEMDEHDKKSLIGYDYSKGYRDFPGLGWSALVLDDVRTAFLPIERLKIIIFGVGTIAGLVVIAVSLIVSQKMTAPIVKISEAAAGIAKGDFRGKIDYSSNDEIGSLSKTFNKMIQDLEKQRAQLVDKDYVDSIISDMIDTLIVFDPEGKIKTVNRATLELLGYRKEELIGKYANLIFPEEVFKTIRFQKIARDGFTENREVTYKTKEDKAIPMLFSGSLLRSKQGKVEGVLAIAKDITERKEKEEALKAAYEELKETHDQLIQAEKLQAVGQLASGVAHEVKNPLAIILQGINYLEKKVPREEKNAEVLSLIKNNVIRADSIVRGLVDFSRVTKLDIKPEDVNAILENSLVLVQHRFRLESVEIIKDMKKDLPLVMVDKRNIEQVFVNIFLNAVQAMHGGGKLFIRSYRVEMDKLENVEEKRKENYFVPEEKVVIIEVEDTGSGISRENLKRVFDPFFTTKGPQQGTGLGLSVTRNIIDMHKGLIQIKSEEHEGTRVRIILKIERGEV